MTESTWKESCKLRHLSHYAIHATVLKTVNFIQTENETLVLTTCKWLALQTDLGHPPLWSHCAWGTARSSAWTLGPTA